jgi:APA family basic amino acid/polyamine antiporter
MSGASYAWPARFIGPFFGFFIAWLRILGSTAVIVQHGVVLVNYASAGLGIGIPGTFAMAVIFTVFFGFNVIGISTTSRVQLFILTILVTSFALFCLVGARHFQPTVFSSGPPPKWSSILAAVPLLVGLFIGIEFSAEIGEEVQDAPKAIPIGLCISIVVVLLLYLSVMAISFGVSGAAVLARSPAPILAVSKTIFGRWATPIVLAITLSALTASLNGAMLIFSRYLFAMARNGALPEIMARVHPRWGTPYVALIAVYSLSLLGLFLPTSLVFLFIAVNVPTMLKYCSSCLSAILLLRRHPHLYEQARFKLPKGLLLAVALGGMVLACSIIVLGIASDWRPYVVLIVWGAAGTIYWHLWKRRERSAVTRTDEHGKEMSSANGSEM